MNNNNTYRFIAGIDEAGRGPLAGPVVAAAVILDSNQPISFLADSKLLTEKRRENLYTEIVTKVIAWGVGRAEVEEIDTINIHHATLLAMQRAVAALAVAPNFVQIDGKFCPKLTCPAEAIVKGDQTIPAISAASIIAKVTRDREMVILDQEYPGYGLAQHKGYGTKAHKQAIQKLGLSKIHRLSFQWNKELG